MTTVRGDKFVMLAALLFVAFAVFSGPVRMVLTVAGLSPLIYVPNALLLAAVAWAAIDEPNREGYTGLRLIAAVLIAGAVLIGLQFSPVKQVAMGIWVLLPFLFGLACGTIVLRQWPLVMRVAPWLWFAATGGVLLNVSMSFPWEGFEYAVAGMDVEGSREWWAAGGTKRLAGFARSSFDAAVQIQVLGVIAVLGAKHPGLRLVIWAATYFGISLTTSKGMIAVWAVLTPIVLLRQHIPGVLLRPVPLAFGMLGLALPVSTLLYGFTPDNSGDAALVNALSSFYDRLNNMWPEAWHLLFDQGNAVIGRGIGGIGTPQSYFEPARFNAADNIFMYWFVVFGFAAVPGFLLLLLRTLRLKPFRDEQQTAVYCLLIAMLVYGLIANIVENAAFAIAAGVVVRWLAGSPSIALKPGALK